jgi:formylglycine-generating enzyme required for sulfatase activity
LSHSADVPLLKEDSSIVWTALTGKSTLAEFGGLDYQTVLLLIKGKPAYRIPLPSLEPKSRAMAEKLDRSGVIRGRVVFKWATVGNPRNPPPEHLTLGAVAYSYRMSRYEVTNAQYAVFLNSTDPKGVNPHGVYNPKMGSSNEGGISLQPDNLAGSKYTVRTAMEDKPVTFVSYADAMRFVNWLQNAQDGRMTEAGAYDVASNISIRSPNATVWIPTESEWFKAAYYSPKLSKHGHYYKYATQSNDAPEKAKADASGNISNPGRNVANYDKGAEWSEIHGHLTSVGTAGEASTSFYGTSDQNGNVEEWIEPSQQKDQHLLIGGAWASTSQEVVVRGYMPMAESQAEVSSLGFRVACRMVTGLQ